QLWRTAALFRKKSRRCDRKKKNMKATAKRSARFWKTPGQARRISGRKRRRKRTVFCPRQRKKRAILLKKRRKRPRESWIAQRKTVRRFLTNGKDRSTKILKIKVSV